MLLLNVEIIDGNNIAVLVSKLLKKVWRSSIKDIDSTCAYRYQCYVIVLVEVLTNDGILDKWW